MCCCSLNELLVGLDQCQRQPCCGTRLLIRSRFAPGLTKLREHHISSAHLRIRLRQLPWVTSTNPDLRLTASKRFALLLWKWRMRNSPQADVHEMLIFCFAAGGEFICLCDFAGAFNRQSTMRGTICVLSGGCCQWPWSLCSLMPNGKTPLRSPGADIFAIIYLVRAIKKQPPPKDNACGTSHVSPLNHWS